HSNRAGERTELREEHTSIGAGPMFFRGPLDNIRGSGSVQGASWDFLAVDGIRNSSGEKVGVDLTVGPGYGPLPEAHNISTEGSAEVVGDLGAVCDWMF
ncbi:MAG TPA: hypothetical protein VFV75_08355, partial [Candidatus Polarisedimenticolaceae bacterium]|nr:hypothetical protein [Candidatus Polarisedimenticolaceae bacterium]